MVMPLNGSMLHKDVRDNRTGMGSLLVLFLRVFFCPFGSFSISLRFRFSSFGRFFSFLLVHP